MNKTVIMQGDAYAKPLRISIDKEVVPEENIDDIEVFIGNCRKTLKQGALSYDSEMGAWLLHLSQEDTFSMPEGRQVFQVRIKLSNGEVIGKDLPDIGVIRAKSKEVL